MSPPDYRRARNDASSSDVLSSSYCVFIDSRPYLPNLDVDVTVEGEISVARAAASVVLASRAGGLSGASSVLDDANVERLDVNKVSGGITNSLYRVSGLSSFLGDLTASTKTNGKQASSEEDDSVLVRVFGAEGMIDRDVETSTYAALCDSSIADQYLGRFSNGRIEGWLEGYKTLHKSDLGNPTLSNAIAVQMARLHRTFQVPVHLREDHNPDKPAMWTQLHSWMDQASGYAGNFKTSTDNDRAADLDLPRISSQLTHLEKDVVPADARVAFCHNDLLAANIMCCPKTGSIQLIDFEYGGVNYVSFDIANHFNEHAGGTDEEDNGVPDYGKFPSEERQEEFVRAYVQAARDGADAAEGDTSEDEEVRSLLMEVHAFVLANHLYWGLWAVNQAAMEGCENFDYLEYAKNRFSEYYRAREEVERHVANK